MIEESGSVHLMDPDPGGQKIYGSGSAKLIPTATDVPYGTSDTNNAFLDVFVKFSLQRFTDI
jgi:hypothetical protein